MLKHPSDFVNMIKCNSQYWVLIDCGWTLSKIEHSMGIHWYQFPSNSYITYSLKILLDRNGQPTIFNLSIIQCIGDLQSDYQCPQKRKKTCDSKSLMPWLLEEHSRPSWMLVNSQDELITPNNRKPSEHSVKSSLWIMRHCRSRTSEPGSQCLSLKSKIQSIGSHIFYKICATATSS